MLQNQLLDTLNSLRAAKGQQPVQAKTTEQKIAERNEIVKQREIEQAVFSALAAGQLKGDETLQARVTLEIPQLNLKVPFEGEVKLK